MDEDKNKQNESEEEANLRFLKFAQKQMDEFHEHNKRIMYKQEIEKKRLKEEKYEFSMPTIIIIIVIIVIVVLFNIMK